MFTYTYIRMCVVYIDVCSTCFTHFYVYMSLHYCAFVRVYVLSFCMLELLMCVRMYTYNT